MDKKPKDQNRIGLPFRQMLCGTRFEEHIEYVIRMSGENWLKGLEKNGFGHSKSIESYLNRLVPLQVRNKLSPAEIYLLLCAVYLHDVGHKINPEDHINSGAQDIEKNYPKYGFRNEYVAYAVSQICRAHGPEKDYPIGKFEHRFSISGLPDFPRRLDLRFLGSLLRIADEIDSAYDRVMGRGHPSKDLRCSILNVDIDTKLWLIVFQTKPSSSFEWIKLDWMRRHVQERLNDLVDIFDGKGLRYHENSIIMTPPINPFLEESRKIFGQKPLDPHFAETFVGLADVGNLWDCVNSTQGKRFDEVNFLGGNALTLLKILGEDFKGKDLSRTVLANADLSYADFTGTKFNKAILKNANLKYTILKNASFMKTDLEGATFDGPDEIYDVSWSPNESFIAIGGRERAIRVIETKTFTESAKFTGHANEVNSISWNSESDRLVSGSIDDTVRTWDLNTCSCVGAFSCHIGGVKKLQLARDEQLMICLGQDNKLQVWNLQEGEPNVLKLKIDEITSILSTRNVEFTFIGSLNGTIGFLSRSEGYTFKVITNLPVSVECLALSSDKTRLYAGCLDGKIRVLCLGCEDMTLEREAYEMRGIYFHRGPIKSLALSSDDKRLASGGNDSRIILWDTEKSEPIDIMIGNDSRVNSVTFSPSGDYLASGGADKNIRIWNVVPDGENFGAIVRCIGSNCDGVLFEGAIGVDKSTMEFLLARKAKASIQKSY